MARRSHFSPRPARGVFHILRYHEKTTLASCGEKVKIHESAQVGSFFTIKRHVLLFTMARKSHFSPRPARGVFHILRYHEKQLCRVVVKNASHGEKFGPGPNGEIFAPIRGLRNAARIRSQAPIPPTREPQVRRIFEPKGRQAE